LQKKPTAALSEDFALGSHSPSLICQQLYFGVKYQLLLLSAEFSPQTDFFGIYGWCQKCHCFEKLHLLVLS